MEARNRSLPAWFERIQSRQIQLPRFQRFEAWGSREVSDLIATVLRKLPAGATLILEVGDNLPFVSRPLVTAPATGERTTELLLDGQQRLTALWRALNDNYEDRTYFVRTDAQALSDPEAELVVGQARWVKEGTRYPVWADTPADVWTRGLIPLRLLRPGDLTAEIDTWVDAAAGDDHQLSKLIDRTVQALRERVTVFNLPFLALPATTAKGVALDVFLKLNTSSVKLSTFDIIVAQMEGKTGESLHDQIAKLNGDVPNVGSYGKPEKLVLDAIALHQGKSPNQTGYWALDFDEVLTSWERTTGAVRGAIGFLEEECIFDDDRLPTGAVLGVLAGIWPYLPAGGDALGNARTLLRKYLWRGFLTSRYEQAAATASFQDFRGLRAVLNGSGTEAEVPILDERQFPKPTAAQIIAAGWPKGRGILSRGLLGISLRRGAQDIADGTPVSREHILKREYHHLFPAALLSGAGVPQGQSYSAMNCALITWRTNRTIGAKSPADYLRERSDNATLGVEELRRRLATHVIPADELLTSVGASAPAGDIIAAFERFAAARAELMLRAIDALWEGRVLGG